MNPLNFLARRNILEQLKRLARIVKDAPGAPPESIERDSAITLPPELVRPENRKRYAQERDPASIDCMVGHVMDVTGGFGVQKWGPDGWKKWGGVMPDWAMPMVGEMFDEFVDVEALDDGMAEALALCSRYAQTPYHRLASRKLGECINRPLEHRTKASGLGNGGIALAMDMGNREPITAEFAKAGQNMVRRAFFDLTRWWDDGPELDRRIWYTNHSMFAADRRGDTHRIAHLAVFKPAIMSLRADGLNVAIDYERQVGGGRALTTRDDPDAHFDPKGRRVRTREGQPV